MCSARLTREQPCNYQPPEGIGALKRKNRELEKTIQPLYDVLEFLRVAPTDVAIPILHILRGCGSVAEMVETMNSYVLASASPSPTSAARDLLLPTGLAVGSDLTARYSNAFPKLQPLDVSKIDLFLLGHGKRVNLSAPRLKKRRRILPKKPLESLTGRATQLPSRATAADLHGYADPRLALLDVRPWTTIRIPDSFAAQAISFYLLNEHPVLAFFDADLFIRDLVSGGESFCSPLLLSSLLAWAFVRSSVLTRVAHAFSYGPLREVMRSWTLQDWLSATPFSRKQSYVGWGKAGATRLLPSLRRSS